MALALRTKPPAEVLADTTTLKPGTRIRPPGPLPAGSGSPGAVRVDTISLRSLARMAALATLALWGAMAVAAVSLALLAGSTGQIGGLERFLAASVGASSFEIPVLDIVGASIVVTLVAAVMLVSATVLAGAIYNRVAAVVGGVELGFTRPDRVAGGQTS